MYVQQVSVYTVCVCVCVCVTQVAAAAEGKAALEREVGNLAARLEHSQPATGHTHLTVGGAVGDNMARGDSREESSNGVLSAQSSSGKTQSYLFHC